jgi:hypothetical protein
MCTGYSSLLKNRAGTRVRRRTEMGGDKKIIIVASYGTDDFQGQGFFTEGEMSGASRRTTFT